MDETKLEMAIGFATDYAKREWRNFADGNFHIAQSTSGLGIVAGDMGETFAKHETFSTTFFVLCCEEHKVKILSLSQQRHDSFSF